MLDDDALEDYVLGDDALGMAEAAVVAVFGCGWLLFSSST